VITSLKQANAGNAPFCSSRHAVAHQCASNSLILHSRIDRDRTDACNRRPLIHKIAADDLVIDFGNDCVKSWICDKLREQSNRYFRGGQIGRKIMLISDCCECFITNCAAALSVIGGGCAQLYVHRKLNGGCRNLSALARRVPMVLRQFPLRFPFASRGRATAAARHKANTRETGQPASIRSSSL
jgi:hypothetical protein